MVIDADAAFGSARPFLGTRAPLGVFGKAAAGARWSDSHCKNGWFHHAVPRLGEGIEQRQRASAERHQRSGQRPSRDDQTISIVSNEKPETVVAIAISAWDGTTPLDRRDAIITQVPADRVASLTVTLSASCSSHVTATNGEVALEAAVRHGRIRRGLGLDHRTLGDRARCRSSERRNPRSAVLGQRRHLRSPLYSLKLH